MHPVHISAIFSKPRIVVYTLLRERGINCYRNICRAPYLVLMKCCLSAIVLLFVIVAVAVVVALSICSRSS